MENLKKLHELRFMHRDIKPGNIAYSNTNRKNVFIDFGLSKLISEPPGEKSITAFTGTLSFCSQ